MAQLLLIHAAYETEPVFVASYETVVDNPQDLDRVCGALENVWTLTQNIYEDGWAQTALNRGKASQIKPLGIVSEAKSRRSTSVGDYALCNGKLYRCARVGWEEATEIVCNTRGF